MKRLFLLCLLTISLASCSVDSDLPDFHTEYLPVESVTMPSEFVFGEVYTIHLSYLRPSGCHIFNNFYYASEGNQRTVAIITTVYSNPDCQIFDNEIVEVSFDFMANSTGTYVFRFWQGKDTNGNDTYYIVEVPVVE